MQTVCMYSDPDANSMGCVLLSTLSNSILGVTLFPAQGTWGCCCSAPPGWPAAPGQPPAALCPSSGLALKIDPVLAPRAQRHEGERKILEHLSPHPTRHSKIAAAHQYVTAGHTQVTPCLEGSGRAENFSLRTIFAYFQFYLLWTLVSNLHWCNPFFPFTWEPGRSEWQANKCGLWVLSFLFEWNFAASSVRWCSWTFCIFQALKDTVNYNVIEKWVCFLEMKCNQ